MKIPANVRTGVAQTKLVVRSGLAHAKLLSDPRLNSFQSITSKMILAKQIPHQIKTNLIVKQDAVKTKLLVTKGRIAGYPTRNWTVTYVRTTDSSIGKSGIIEVRGTELVGDGVTVIESKMGYSKIPIGTTEREVQVNVTMNMLDKSLQRRYPSLTGTSEKVTPDYLNKTIQIADKKNSITLAGGEVQTPMKNLTETQYEGRVVSLVHSKNVQRFDSLPTIGDLTTVSYNDRRIVGQNFKSMTDTGKYVSSSGEIKEASITQIKTSSFDDLIVQRTDMGMDLDLAKSSTDPIQSITTPSQDLIEARTLLAKKKELFEANKGNYNSPTLRLVDEVKQESIRTLNQKKQTYNVFPSGNAPYEGTTLGNIKVGNTYVAKTEAYFTGKATGGTPLVQIHKTPIPEPVIKPKVSNIESGNYLKVKDIYKRANTTNASPFKYPKGVYTPAVGEIVYTSSVLTPKGTVKTNVNTSGAVITNVQSKISTGLKQDTAQNLKTDSIQKLNTRLETGSKMKIKLDTGLKSAQRQRTVQAYNTPFKMITTQPRKAVTPLPIPILQFKIKSTRGRSKRGKKAGFIGNVRLDNIMGMYKRKEITYGESKVTKLERQDARLTSGTSNRIAMPASGLLKTKKKKKEKKTSIFGGGKDEFKGFGSKPKGKKKKSSLFG